MEVNEGMIRITTQPFVTIDGKPMSECRPQVVAREIYRLCRRVSEQRATIARLRGELVKESANASK